MLGFSNFGGLVVNDSPEPKITAVLPWIPQTTSAVALRLMELDVSIFYTLQQKEDFEKDRGTRQIIVSISCSL